MKLALKLDYVSNLRKILGFILLLRKQCIFKFTTEQLIIISIDQESPIIWNTIEGSTFKRFDVISKDNYIGLELNAEPLFQILKKYEKSPVTSELILKLHRSEETYGNNSLDNTNSVNSNKRRMVYLAVSYNEDISCTTEINHSFNIPVNLLRNRFLDKIQMPSVNNIKLILDLNLSLVPLFERVDRYKAIDIIKIITNRLGEIKIELQDEGKKMSIKWKGFLETCLPEDVDTQNSNEHREQNNQDLNMIRDITIKVKSKWWNYVSKLIEMCETLQMHVHEDGCVFSCHVEDEQNCTILYFLPGKLVDQ